VQGGFKGTYCGIFGFWNAGAVVRAELVGQMTTTCRRRDDEGSRCGYRIAEREIDEVSWLTQRGSLAEVLIASRIKRFWNSALVIKLVLLI